MISDKEISYEQIFDIIENIAAEDVPIIIAIDGACGSGKSTLAELIESKFDSNVFHMDDFFLPEKLRTDERLSEIGGNADYVRFKKDVIDNIKRDTPFEYRKFSCKNMQLSDELSVKPKRINICEGSYSMHPHLIDKYDLKIYLEIDSDTQIERIRIRSGEQLLKRFIEEWIPMENRYFSAFKIRDKADYITTMPSI